MVRKHTLPCRLSQEGHSWSDVSCAQYMCFSQTFLIYFTKCGLPVGHGAEVSFWGWGDGSLGRGMVLPPFPAWLPSCRLIHAPLTIAVDGLLSVPELLWALTLFLHYHLGMRQLKASGNLGFIDISRRPQPGSICFPWQVSPTPAYLPGCRPCTQPVALTAALLWEDTPLSTETAALWRDGGGGGKWGWGHTSWCEIREGRTCLLLVSCFNVSFWEEHREGMKQHQGQVATGLVSLSSQRTMEPTWEGAQESPSCSHPQGLKM